MTPEEAFDALMLETIPTRPTPADPLTSFLGPTAAFLRLERQRLLWATRTLWDDDDELEETA